MKDEGEHVGNLSVLYMKDEGEHVGNLSVLYMKDEGGHWELVVLFVNM